MEPRNHGMLGLGVMLKMAAAAAVEKNLYRKTKTKPKKKNLKTNKLCFFLKKNLFRVVCHFYITIYGKRQIIILMTDSSSSSRSWFLLHSVASLTLSPPNSFPKNACVVTGAALWLRSLCLDDLKI